MRRWLTTLTLALFAALALAAARPVSAQTVTRDDLAAVALPAADVPELAVVGDQVTSITGVIDTLYIRIFADAVTHSLLTVNLLVSNASQSVDDLAPAVSGVTFLRTAARTAGTRSSNFTVFSPLGFGDDDIAGSWDGFAGQSDIALRFYADYLLQGRLVTVIVYAAPPDAVDPAQLSRYTQLQEAKTAASSLPRPLIGSGR